jgi:hypothetical protein
MSEGFTRRRPSSPPPAPLPDNDDLLQEILLRLSTSPSSLPRASLVCKRWRRLLSDPGFLRRFRVFHHREPPLLGLFTYYFFHGNTYFTPALDPPNRIHSTRFSLALPRGWMPHDCRRGLVLFYNRPLQEFIVWDPVARDQRHVAVPHSSAKKKPGVIHRAGLFCDDHHAGLTPLEAFKVVSLWFDDPFIVAEPQVSASLYESKTGVWSNIISTSITAKINVKPSILVGNSLCWLLRNGSILEFDLDRQSLAVIHCPVYTRDIPFLRGQILRMEDDRLGLAILFDRRLQLWERKADSNGVARWMLQKRLELDKFLSVRSPLHELPVIQGYDEDGHVMFISVETEVFTIQLRSMQFSCLFKTIHYSDLSYFPFRSFYTAGNSSSLSRTIFSHGFCNIFRVLKIFFSV